MATSGLDTIHRAVKKAGDVAKLAQALGYNPAETARLYRVVRGETKKVTAEMVEAVKAYLALDTSDNGSANGSDYTSLTPDIERKRAEQHAQDRARAAGVGSDSYERPYTYIAGQRIPLPLRDVEVDEETGRPLAAYVTLHVALGPPRLRKVAALSSDRSER